MTRYASYLVTSVSTIILFFLLVATIGDAGFGLFACGIITVILTPLVGMLVSNILYDEGF
jgi:hypothetical protein